MQINPDKYEWTPKEEIPDDLASKIQFYRWNFPEYCRDHVKIATKEGGLSPFVLYRHQLRLWMKIKTCLEAGLPVRVYILKARQMGFSTMIAALGYWFTTLNKYRNALLCGYDGENAGTIFRITKKVHKFMDRELRPKRKRNNRKELYFATEKGGQESIIVIDTAGNEHLGAGYTPHFVHLSEYARYPSIQKDFDNTMISLNQGIPREPWTFVFRETTAYGTGQPKDEWEDEDSNYIRFFAPWVEMEKYRLDEDHPAWKPKYEFYQDDFYKVEDSKYGDEERYFDLLQSVLDRLFPALETEAELEKEALRCIRWRRMMIDDELKGDKDKFSREYPLTAAEAWLLENNTVFDVGQLKADDDRTSEIQPKLMEVLPGGSARPNPRGGLRVYEEPESGTFYAIGADPAQGLETGDYTVAQVLRLPDFKQVATYQAKTPPDAFAQVLNDLGEWYNQAWIMVEVPGPGGTVNMFLWREHEYPYLYHRENPEDVGPEGSEKDRLGWHNNRATKDLLVNYFRSAYRLEEVEVNDHQTIQEMWSYVKDDRGRFGAESGHDDLVEGLMIAYQMAIRANESAAAHRGKTDEKKYTFRWWMNQA